MNARKLLLLTALFLIILFTFPSLTHPPQVAAQPGSIGYACSPSRPVSAADSSPSLTVQALNRTVSINGYGLVTIKDNFTVVNTGVENAWCIDVFYPSNLYTHLLQASARDRSGSTLTIENVSSPYEGKRVVFNYPVPPGGTYVFTLTQTFNGLVHPNGSSLVASMCRYPLIAHPVSNCTILVSLPENATPQYPYPEGATFQNGSLIMNDSNIGPFNNTAMDVNYYGPLVRIEWHFRYVSLDPWRGVEVFDFYRVRNDGPQQVSRLECMVAPVPVQLLAYDALNVIGAWPEGGKIYVYPRFPLKQNYTYAYYVKYLIPMPAYHVGAYGKYLFAFPVTQSYDTVIPATVTVISLSGELTVKAMQPPSPFLQSGTMLNVQTLLFFSTGNVSPGTQRMAYIYYTSPMLALYLRPASFTLIIFSALMAVMIAVRARVKAAPPPAEEVKVEVEVSGLLEELCDLYEERHLLILEEDELKRRYSAGKVKKFEFTKRRSDIEKQLKELEKRIGDAKSRLLSIDKRYEPEIDELETAETQVEQAGAALDFVRRRYMTGKIGKEVYEKLKREQEKKRDKAISKVDRKLQDLRRKALYG